jgi:hypothetical protein
MPDIDAEAAGILIGNGCDPCTAITDCAELQPAAGVLGAGGIGRLLYRVDPRGATRDRLRPSQGATTRTPLASSVSGRPSCLYFIGACPPAEITSVAVSLALASPRAVPYRRDALLSLPEVLILGATILIAGLLLGDSADELAVVNAEKVLARVGDELILEKDVSSYVDEVISLTSEKIPNDQTDAIRKKLAESRLNHLIDVKLAFIDAREQAPSEAMDKIKQSLADDFESKEIPRKLREKNVRSRQELEERLTKERTSLEDLKRTYIEEMISYGWVMQQVNQSKQTTNNGTYQATRQYLAQLKLRYPVEVLGGE